VLPARVWPNRKRADLYSRRAWPALKSYRHNHSPRPVWTEYVRGLANHLRIQDQNYYLSGDGLLTPAKKGQPPPDLSHFRQGQR
jgi:hypothetical protein